MQVAITNSADYLNTIGLDAVFQIALNFIPAHSISRSLRWELSFFNVMTCAYFRVSNNNTFQWRLISHSKHNKQHSE